MKALLQMACKSSLKNPDRFEHIKQSKNLPLYEFKNHDPIAVRFICFETDVGYVVALGLKKCKAKEFRRAVDKVSEFYRRFCLEGEYDNEKWF